MAKSPKAPKASKAPKVPSAPKTPKGKMPVTGMKGGPSKSGGKGC